MKNTRAGRDTIVFAVTITAGFRASHSPPPAIQVSLVSSAPLFRRSPVSGFSVGSEESEKPPLPRVPEEGSFFGMSTPTFRKMPDCVNPGAVTKELKNPFLATPANHPTAASTSTELGQKFVPGYP